MGFFRVSEIIRIYKRLYLNCSVIFRKISFKQKKLKKMIIILNFSIDKLNYLCYNINTVINIVFINEFGIAAKFRVHETFELSTFLKQ